MTYKYLVQPTTLFGTLLLELLKTDPAPKKVVFVSAFAAWQTMMRFKAQLLDLHAKGCKIRIILGVDMGGTSKEVLEEVGTWPVEVLILKNRKVGHTFHPKLYLVEWEGRATILAGSNNMTEGGFFRNYELSSQATYTLPREAEAYAESCDQLVKFLEPTGDTIHLLDAEYLAGLLKRRDIPSEAEVNERRRKDFAGSKQPTSGEASFGYEAMPAAPPLPADLLAIVAARVAARKQIKKKTVKPPEAAAVAVEEDGVEDVLNVTETEPTVETPPDVQIMPQSFYMSLPKLQGNIPGEPRIPIAALDMAQEFWGWPEKYTKLTSPRSGKNTEYYEWYSNWTIRNVATPGSDITQSIRLYRYPNRSEFRFYARPLKNAGADVDDIVCITRTGDDSYDCTLARQGTAEHTLWATYCTHRAPGKNRPFGYS